MSPNKQVESKKKRGKLKEHPTPPLFSFFFVPCTVFASRSFTPKKEGLWWVVLDTNEFKTNKSVWLFCDCRVWRWQTEVRLPLTDSLSTSVNLSWQRQTACHRKHRCLMPFHTRQHDKRCIL